MPHQALPGTLDQGDWPTYLESSFSALLLGSKLNCLLIFYPVAIIASAMDLDGSITFVASLLALCPLAERVGFATEQLTLHTNSTLGGRDQSDSNPRGHRNHPGFKFVWFG